jgi:hypothetical protein
MSEKIQRIKEILRDNIFLQGEGEENQDWALNDAVDIIQSLETSLSASKAENERLREEPSELLRRALLRCAELEKENARLQKRVEELEGAGR